MTTNIDTGLNTLLDILERRKAEYQQARMDADAAWVAYRIDPSPENGAEAELADLRKNAAFRRMNVSYGDYWEVADAEGLSPYIQVTSKR